MELGVQNGNHPLGEERNKLVANLTPGISKGAEEIDTSPSCSQHALAGNKGKMSKWARFLPSARIFHEVRGHAGRRENLNQGKGSKEGQQKWPLPLTDQS